MMWYLVDSLPNNGPVIEVKMNGEFGGREECRDFPHDGVHVCIIHARDAEDAISKYKVRHKCPRT